MRTALSTPLPAIRWAACAPLRDHATGCSALLCDGPVAAICCCRRQPKNGGLVGNTAATQTLWRQMSTGFNGNDSHLTHLGTCASLSEARSVVSETVESDRDLDAVVGAPFFSGSSLDTAAHLRGNTEALQALLHSPSSKLIPWFDEQVLVQDAQQAPNATSPRPKDLSPDGHPPSLVPVLLSPAFQHLPSLDPAVGTVFMGLQRGSGNAVFAGMLKPGEAQGVEEVVGGRWVSLRSVGPQLSAADAGLLAMAHGLLVWHMDELHCGKTGQSTESTLGGHARITQPGDAVKEETRPIIRYPRIDPAVITLVTSGDYCLLGRKHGWRKNRYSLLAGFMEVGETMESAVAREVLEEAAVKVAPESVKYIGSQPWPFPRSLMVAFRAAAAHPADKSDLVQGAPYHFSGHLVPGGTGFDRLKGVARSAAIDSGILPHEVDEYLGTWLPRPRPQEDELERVGWFHRDFLAKVALSRSGPGDMSIPGGYAIARKVLDAWVADGRPGSWAGDSVDDVRIDTGRFKYVMLRVGDGDRSKLVVRGSTAAKYHMNLLEAAKKEYGHLGLDLEPVGGGRIEHDPGMGSLSIYGYSSAFGQAVHDVAAALCVRWMPLYDATGINVSYDGY